MDTLSNALSKIKNAELAGKLECTITPSSNILKRILEVLKEKSYIEGFEHIDTRQGGKVKVKLSKKINNIGTIKPRFFVKKTEYEKYEKRYLPARGFGIILISTPKGIMTHEKAREENLGGRLIAFCY